MNQPHALSLSTAPAANIRTRVGVVSLLLLGGCFGGTGFDTVEAACNDELNVDEAICSCLSERALANLSEDGAHWLAAAIRKDEATTAEMRESLPWTELLAANMFLVSAPTACATELSSKVTTAE